MNWIPLELKHQPLLDPIWKSLTLKHNLVLSEYSFANNYLFRKAHNYQLNLEGDFPILKGSSRKGDEFILPTFDPASLPKKKLCDLLTILPLYPIPDQWLEYFSTLPVATKSNRYQSDYLFTTEKLKELKGRRLSSRRNLLHQLLNNHHTEVHPLNSLEVQPALVILDEWQKQTSLTTEQSDYFSCQEALTYIEQFNLIGRLCFVDGIPAGFTLGEQLTPSTVILHFSKALHQYKGLTPFLYEDFAAHIPEGTRWINLEQDLDIPSLRQAKEAYDPDCLVNKWQVFLERPC